MTNPLPISNIGSGLQKKNTFEDYMSNTYSQNYDAYQNTSQYNSYTPY